EEVAFDEPRCKEFLRVRFGNSMCLKQVAEFDPGIFYAIAVHLNGPDRIRELLHDSGAVRSLLCIGDQQPLHNDQKKASISERRFEEPEPVQGAIDRVPGQIEDKLNDNALREDRAALFDAALRKPVNGL